MSRFTFIAIISLLLSTRGVSQTAVVKGTVIDSIGNANLTNAVVYLKKSENSALLAYTRVNTHGEFELKNVSQGRLIVVVTFPGYVDWVDSVYVAGNGVVTVPVFMMTKAHLLEEVVVRKSIAPIRIKGDTTEFLADSFHVKPDATVEDLLRVLPGMSVNSKGQISSNGQRVQNVLVDGEEFFGNDPTMATQNLSKSDIAKVQVYDKKSERSLITGIDDGVKQKTINLILKDDSKKGYFGELSGGTDFDKYYQTKATISRFTNKIKMGALFSMDRTGRETISFEEEKDFGTSSDSKQGIPETIQAAAMFNQKFGSLNSTTANNIAYNHQNLTGNSYSGNKYIIHDTVYYSNQNSINSSNAWQKVLNSKNEFKLDSLTTLIVNAKIKSGELRSNSLREGGTLETDNTTFVNRSEQNIFSSGNFSGGSADIYLKRMFDRKGLRFLTINASFVNNARYSESLLYNRTDYYTSGNITGQQITDQKKINNQVENGGIALISYTMPVTKKLGLNLNYTFNITHTDQDIRTYEKQAGKYDSLDLLYSNHYLFTNGSHKGGFGTTFTDKKITFKTGLAVQDIVLRQQNLYDGTVKDRGFVNLFPSANLSWKYSKVGNLSFNYYGRTQQPTLAQLQPVLNNADPLNIQIGNDQLRPAFYHNFDFQIDQYRPAKGTSLRGSGSLSLAQNDFSSISNIDPQGKRVFQTINVDGNYAYSAWISYGFGLNFFKTTITLQPKISGSHYINYVNGVKNSNDVTSFLPTIWISGYINKVLDIQSSYSYEFRNLRSSITPSPTNYHVHSIFLYGSYYGLSGWSFSTSCNYNIREKLSPADVNTDAIIWNASVEKSLFGKSNLTAIVRLNDILNQNIGFNRSVTGTSISENTYSTIQRYAMFSLRWKFNNNNRKTNP